MGANISNSTVNNSNTVISGGSTEYDSSSKITPTNTISPDVTTSLNPLNVIGKVEPNLLDGTFSDEIVRFAFNHSSEYGYESYNGFLTDILDIGLRLGIFRSEKDKLNGLVSINSNAIKSLSQNISTVSGTFSKTIRDDVNSKTMDKITSDINSVMELYDEAWSQDKSSGLTGIKSKFTDSISTNDYVSLVSEDYFDNPGGYITEKRGLLDALMPSKDGFIKIAKMLANEVIKKPDSTDTLLSAVGISKNDGVRLSKSDSILRGEAMLPISTLVEGLMSMSRTSTFSEMLESKSNAVMAAFTSSSPNILNQPNIESSLRTLSLMSDNEKSAVVDHLHMAGNKYGLSVVTSGMRGEDKKTNDKPDTNFVQSLINCTPTVNGLLAIDVRKNKDEFTNTFIGNDLVESLIATPSDIKLTSVKNYAMYTSTNIDDIFSHCYQPFPCTMSAQISRDTYIHIKSEAANNAQSGTTICVPPVPDCGYTEKGLVVLVEPMGYVKRDIHEFYESEISLAYEVSSLSFGDKLCADMIPSVIIGTTTGLYYLPMVEDVPSSTTKRYTTINPPDPVIIKHEFPIQWIPVTDAGKTIYSLTLTIPVTYSNKHIDFYTNDGKMLFTMLLSQFNTIFGNYKGKLTPTNSKSGSDYCLVPGSFVNDVWSIMMSMSSFDKRLIIVGNNGRTEDIYLVDNIFETTSYKVRELANNTIRGTFDTASDCYRSIYRCNFSTRFLATNTLAGFMKLMDNSGSWSNISTTLDTIPFTFRIGLVSRAFPKPFVPLGSTSPLNLLVSSNVPTIMYQISCHTMSTPSSYTKKLPGWVWDNKIINVPLLSFLTMSDPHTIISISPLDIHTVWANFVSCVRDYVPKVVELLLDKNYSSIITKFGVDFANYLDRDSHYNFSSNDGITKYIIDALFDMPNWMYFRSGSPLCSMGHQFVPQVAWSLITTLTSLSQTTIFSSSSLQTIVSASNNMSHFIDVSTEYEYPKELDQAISFNIPQNSNATRSSGFKLTSSLNTKKNNQVNQKIPLSHLGRNVRRMHHIYDV